MRTRLTPRSADGTAGLSVLPMPAIDPVPAGWMEAAVRAAVADAAGPTLPIAAGRLAAAALATTNRTRRLRSAVVLIASTGLVTAWAVGQGALLGRARPVDEPGRAGPRADAGDKLAARQPGACWTTAGSTGST